ncbi:MAG: hypoxanthine phosphoribosyltransferase [Candidatus Schekmanbacteria bacterium]|nr:hypoxanthine phosphoribosyltransferase [Candidatus Schekmanbacteria bacterium]
MDKTVAHAISAPLITAERIQERVAELAHEINRDFSADHLLVVGILKGAFVFMADLVRRLDLRLQTDFMAISSYGAATRSSGVVRILKDLEEPIEGRSVLIVEDIVDTGLTLSYLLALLRERRPARLATCVLLDKSECRQIPVPVEYVGFAIPNEFVVGYGLDFRQDLRNLPYIAKLHQTSRASA